jgi:putative SOS response-associated peptidase YedK
MCGRYLTPTEADLERHWGLSAPPDYVRSYNVAPSRLAPIVRADPEGRRDMSLATWGFQPGWAKRAWINARSETAFTLKAFASAALKRRCLVPAAGWYEWQGSAAPKQPFVFHFEGFAPFAFAGIWTARRIDEVWHRSFAILTAESHGPLRAIHDRKPAVVAPADYDTWLDATTSPDRAEAMLRRESAGISAYAVSGFVNKPEHDDARCIAPLEASGA